MTMIIVETILGWALAIGWSLIGCGCSIHAIKNKLGIGLICLTSLMCISGIIFTIVAILNGGFVVWQTFENSINGR